MSQPNFRNANFIPGSPAGAIQQVSALTADGQFVLTQGVSLIRLSSNDTTPSNRSFTIQSGPNATMEPAGNFILVLNFTSGANTSCLLLNSGNVRLISDWTPTQGQSLTLQWDGTFWNELARTGAGTLEASGTLSQANLIAMFTTPVQILPQSRSNQAYIIMSVEWFHSYSTAAYTGGGDVSLQYDTGATPIILADVALVTAASNLRTYATPTIYQLDSTTGTATGFNLANALAKSVTVTNAAGVFAAGNVANVLKYKVRYQVVTVLA